MLSRRDFIRLSALAAGSCSVSSVAWSSMTQPSALAAKPVLSLSGRTPTYCEICFWKCAGWVHRNNEGRIWKVTGNDDDQHCTGRFCPRGTAGPGMYYDKDRLKTPLIRTQERGKQVFRQASWEEALGFVSTRIQRIVAEDGPESLALFTHGSGGKYFGDLLKALGSVNITQPSYAQCRGPRDAAFIATFGEHPDSPEVTDIRDTKCLVLIGSHLGENMHNGQVQEMSQAIDKGATIITVDPRFSTAASKSTYWLPIKPATDLALLLSWIHILIEEDRYDRDYVARFCHGFDALKAHVRQFTPEWAYGITTISPELIRNTAREMANASPAVIIHPGRHVTWYGDDTQRVRAVAILNALLGSWGRRGGFYRAARIELPEYPHPPYPKPRRTWRDLSEGRFALADASVSNVLVDASIPKAGQRAPIRGWIVNGTNLINTLPDQQQTLRAIQHLDLLVAIDTMPMEIAGWADVILPECTYLERYDSLRDSPHREPSIALRMPAAEPLYDTKSSYWMAYQLSRRLGLEPWFHFERQEDLLDWQLNQLGSSLEEMKRIGVKTLTREDDLYFSKDGPVEFATPTGKIELFSTTLQAAGFDPLPRYTAHEEPPVGFYRLIYGRAPAHTFSRTANNAHLTDIMDENSLWVNPKTAKQWALENGTYIYLQNQDGVVSEFPIKVRITERIRWDSVYMVHGFGHAQRQLTRSYGKGVSDTQLITRVLIDPIMGGTGMRGNFVTFKRTPKEAEPA